MSTQPAAGPVRILRGRARRLGDHINTDYIISSSRKKETIDPAALKHWLLESVDPGFAASVRPGDILVAGEDFGCGSAMEVAVSVVLAAGIRAVMARSFATTYFRNAINNGLMPIECDTTRIEEGDSVEIRVGPGDVTVIVSPIAAAVQDGGRDTIAGARGVFHLDAAVLPEFILGILDAGGLVNYLRDNGGFPGMST